LADTSFATFEFIEFTSLLLESRDTLNSRFTEV
jgi:hypothetical protein